MEAINEARIDCIEESCNELGISLTLEQMTKIAEDLSTHIEMEYEVESYRHSGGGQRPEFIQADRIPLFKRGYSSGGTFISPCDVHAGYLGDEVWAKETIYIKNPKK